MLNNYNPQPIFLAILTELNTAITEKDWEKVKAVAERLKVISSLD